MRREGRNATLQTIALSCFYEGNVIELNPTLLTLINFTWLM